MRHFTHLSQNNHLRYIQSYPNDHRRNTIKNKTYKYIIKWRLSVWVERNGVSNSYRLKTHPLRSVVLCVPRLWLLVSTFPQPWQTIDPIGWPVICVISSLKCAWNTMRRWLGLGPYLTVRYPLLDVRKSASTVAGDSSTVPDAQNCSHSSQGVKRRNASPLRTPPPPSLALLLRRRRWWLVSHRPTCAHIL